MDLNAGWVVRTKEREQTARGDVAEGARRPRNMSSIGMMDSAFFVGKNELLSWLNNLLQLNYTKVEQCANGAAYCQIMDACYPVSPRLRMCLRVYARAGVCSSPFLSFLSHRLVLHGRAKSP